MSTAERDNTSFLFNDGQKIILVDCPGSALQKVQKLNLDPKNIAAILVTHIHPDHIYGLPAVFHSLMLQEGLIRICGSEESIEFCSRLLDLFGLRQKKFKTQAEFWAIRPGSDVSLAPLADITARPVAHHTSSLAFHFHFQGGLEFLYSGDTPAVSSPVKTSGRLDYLCHDCSSPSRFFIQYPVLNSMHTNSLQLGRLADDAGVKTLIPCHFFGEVEFPLAEIEEELRQNFRGRILLPKDLEKYSL